MKEVTRPYEILVRFNETTGTIDGMHYQEIHGVRDDDDTKWLYKPEVRTIPVAYEEGMTGKPLKEVQSAFDLAAGKTADALAATYMAHEAEKNDLLDKLSVAQGQVSQQQEMLQQVTKANEQFRQQANAMIGGLNESIAVKDKQIEDLTTEKTAMEKERDDLHATVEAMRSPARIVDELTMETETKS